MATVATATAALRGGSGSGPSAPVSRHGDPPLSATVQHLRFLLLRPDILRHQQPPHLTQLILQPAQQHRAGGGGGGCVQLILRPRLIGGSFLVHLVFLFILVIIIIVILVIIAYGVTQQHSEVVKTEEKYSTETPWEAVVVQPK